VIGETKAARWAVLSKTLVFESDSERIRFAEIVDFRIEGNPRRGEPARASRSQVGEQRRLAINGEVAGSAAPK